ncbi:hypothetical protein I302_100978 [Kwoniella bestiolae CBS 10118]|uniref:Glycosyltransferase 61 catalytic domain-containing protein n=1 Tax=Kwoniella bestiolae CBS 10118 TaxID=1296100 RepID=A0A1B9G6N6_9TREE|nr:hypothetical protein I302_04355 [Kwoniella bestiolae CBS 10118]OCF26668.1 hypothetical protein I302_04355 [Kwoniella bestiolae CBS 10118]
MSESFTAKEGRKSIYYLYKKSRITTVILLIMLPLAGVLGYISSTSAHRHIQFAVNDISPYFGYFQATDGNGTIESIYKDGLEKSIWSNNFLTSSIWAPLSLSSCSRTTPSWYAPCIALRASRSVMGGNDLLEERMFAEELIYPDFALPLPVFARDEHRKIWMKAVESIKERATMRKDDDYIVYKSQHGQNFVIHDVEFRPPANFDTWAAETCMSPLARLGALSLAPRNRSIDISTSSTEQQLRLSTSESHLLVNSPDAWSFQHFLDRVTHIVAQASHLSSSSVKQIVLTGRKVSGLVPQLWSRLGFDEKDNEIKHNPSSQVLLSLEKLIYSCKTPLVHPYLSWKALEILKLPWTMSDEEFDTSQKNIVLYVSRSHGGAMNGGRRVVNEAQLLSDIKEFLDERGKGETLQLFEETQYRDLDKLIDQLANRVSAIIGPHGGGLMNHRFMSPQKSLLLEFLPTSRIEFINYEESSILNQTYSTIIVEPAPNTRDDMIIDFQDVRHILDAHLGKDRPEKIQASYQWVAE